EVGIACANANHEVGFTGQEVGAGCSRDPYGSELLGMVKGQGAFTCLRFANRYAGGLCKTCQRSRGFRVKHSSARHNQRPLRLASPSGSLLQALDVTSVARNVPHAFAEKFLGEVKRFSLHVLRKAEGYRAGVAGRSEDAHGFGKGSQQLFGALYAIPI